MKEDPELDLLADIVRLLKKFGPEPFERLAEQLSSPEFLERVRLLLSAGARACRESETKGFVRAKKDRYEGGFRLALVELQKTEPEKASLLLKFYDDLSSKSVLPTLKDLRAFALSAGLPPLTESTRPKALVRLVESLQAQPLEELRKILSRIEPIPDSEDRSLSSWARIILDKDMRTKRSG
jgi:hypothetical protein